MNRGKTNVARFALLWVLPFVCGCHSGKFMAPEKWVRRPESTAAADVTRQGCGRMQIIICYERYWSTHAVVRLVSSDGTAILWDPGGGYWVHDPEAVGRLADLVTSNVPTLEQWWAYRRSFTCEPFNTVFEWETSPGDAERLEAALRKAATALDGTCRFRTDVIRGQCGLAISDYLHLFGAPYVTIRKRYLWPHDLGRHLWHQNPDRVTVFRVESGMEVWTQRISK